MNTSDLKLDLIKAISETNDIGFLNEVKKLLNYKRDESSVRVFNDWEQERIDRAMIDYKNGNVISDEEAQIEIEKWFNEQEK